MGKKGKGRGKGKSQEDSFQGQKGQGAQPSEESSKGKGKGKSQDDFSQGEKEQVAGGHPSEESLKGKEQETSQYGFSKDADQAQRRELQGQPTQVVVKARGRGRGKGNPAHAQEPLSVGRQDAHNIPKDPHLSYFSEPSQAGCSRGRGKGDPACAQEPSSIGWQKDVHNIRKDPHLSIFSEPSQAAKGEESQKPSASADPAKEKFCKKKVIYNDEDQELFKRKTGLNLESESPVKYLLAKRLDFGKLGQPVELSVNYFKLHFKDTSIYHYDVDIFDVGENTNGESLMTKGRTAKQAIEKGVKRVEHQKGRNIGKARCRQIISEMIKLKALKKFYPVYDGQKNLFTSQPLPYKKKISFPIDVNIEGNVQHFFVTIKPVDKSSDKSVKCKGGLSNQIDLQPLIDLYDGRSSEIPQSVLLVYETVMNHREPPFHQVQFRNSFFSLNRKDVYSLGCGLEIWFGHHQSVHLTQLGPVVVINIAAKAFHKEIPVMDYASDVLKTNITKLPKLHLYQINMLTEALKGVQIKVTHQKYPRKYKIKSLSEESAYELTFNDDGNKEISVTEYFQKHYEIKLKFPHLPCLEMQTTNLTYMPLETCIVVGGQPKIGKLTGNLTTKMLKNTAVPPKNRFENISKIAEDVKSITENYMGAFGLIMDVKLLKVEGRIISAPILSYAGHQDDKSRIARPDKKGVWRIQDGKRFFRVMPINNWVLISFADDKYYDRDLLSEFCHSLMKSGNKCGMSMVPVNSINIYGENVTTEKAISDAKRSGAQFAIVVLNRRSKHTYDKVKFLSDFKYNLVTQCMEDKTLEKINDQITTNVCLKINVKLGGINHILLHEPRIFSVRVMVIGVDAIHWPRGYGYPSIVAVVASLDVFASRYALFCDTMRNQKEDKISQEIIQWEKMQRITRHLIKKYQEKNNGEYPHQIVVFRDGVSEGQFQFALQEEVRGIQQACKTLLNLFIPITFIVVQKRHQTRFLLRDRRLGATNVIPGTTVDKDITHPVFFDYFIVAHEGIQGTSKPVHYTVLHNDKKFKSDELQQLCYFLCHTYVRCTRSVSLPAPVFYADLAAYRAKKYADLFCSPDDASTSSSDDIQREFPPQVTEAIMSMKSFENNMFYV